MGALSIDREYVFETRDLEVMKTAAGQLGVAVENARLFTEEQRRAKHLAFLNTISKTAISSQDAEQMMGEIVREIQKNFHYDHIGIKPDGPGDRIYNGANDDGSGTVSVIEIASALATLKPPPRRSIVFMAFFGEEEGLLGSHYYALHPVFPIAKTVAHVNLEQVGRTDATDGPKLAQATFTGYPYSNLPRVFQAAGARVGVRIFSDEKYGDSFFARSASRTKSAASNPQAGEPRIRAHAMSSNGIAINRR